MLCHRPKIYGLANVVIEERHLTQFVIGNCHWYGSNCQNNLQQDGSRWRKGWLECRYDNQLELEVGVATWSGVKWISGECAAVHSHFN